MTPDEFWAMVEITEGCWIWRGPVGRDWYGVATVEGIGSGGAHRIAYILTHSSFILPGMHVCHTCDHPPCVRPSHLFIGSPSDNARDAMRKGLRKGTTAINAKPTHIYLKPEMGYIFCETDQPIKYGEEIHITRDGYTPLCGRGVVTKPIPSAGVMCHNAYLCMKCFNALRMSDPGAYEAKNIEKKVFLGY